MTAVQLALLVLISNSSGIINQRTSRYIVDVICKARHGMNS